MTRAIWRCERCGKSEIHEFLDAPPSWVGQQGPRLIIDPRKPVADIPVMTHEEDIITTYGEFTTRPYRCAGVIRVHEEIVGYVFGGEGR